MSSTPFSERAQTLLKALVETYLKDGQPVGSKTLVDAANLTISSATVRNVMVELEELGLVQTPHTSAGRIPTTLGYRLFVDQLLTIKPMQEQDVAPMRAVFAGEADPQTLLTQASMLLSEVTHMAGLVRVPKRQVQTLKHIEFLPLGGNRVLAILVLSDREVQNRILFCDRDYSRDELQTAANYVTQHFAGRDLRSARIDLLNQLSVERHALDKLTQSVLRVAEAALDTSEQQNDYHVAGQYNLLNLAGGEQLQSLRELFEAFAHKQQILDILDKCLSADGVQIFIGQETGHHALEHFSVVSAPYQIDGEKVGVLAVVGPTRMAYERVIPVVDITARLLSSALSDKS